MTRNVCYVPVSKLAKQKCNFALFNNVLYMVAAKQQDESFAT